MIKTIHISICMKPVEGSYAENAIKHGVSGINVEECKVGVESLPSMVAGQAKIGTFNRGLMITPERVGRFPANVILDGSDEVCKEFPETKSGALNPYKENHQNASSYKFEREKTFKQEANSGSASRFFYKYKDIENG
jgi:hypothetical protein